MTVIRDTINERFGGKLRQGSHSPDGMACALEARSIALGAVWIDDPADDARSWALVNEEPGGHWDFGNYRKRWTDSPSKVKFPDLRPINDRYGHDDDARTAALVPLMEALWDWHEWPKEKRVAWAKTVALRTIKEIVPLALRARGFEERAKVCEQAETLEEGREACKAAATYAAAAAATAAATAAAIAAAAAAATAIAAAAAAAAAAATKRNDILDAACRIWIEAVPQEATA